MNQSKELPKEIQDKIDDEADKFGFVVPYDGSNNFYKDDKVKGYQSGATVWAHIAIGFGDYTYNEGWKSIGNGTYLKRDFTIISSEELLVEYIKTLPQ
jgi:hypothetical protein